MDLDIVRLDKPLYFIARRRVGVRSLPCGRAYDMPADDAGFLTAFIKGHPVHRPAIEDMLQPLVTTDHGLSLQTGWINAGEFARLIGDFLREHETSGDRDGYDRAVRIVSNMLDAAALLDESGEWDDDLKAAIDARGYHEFEFSWHD